MNAHLKKFDWLIFTVICLLLVTSYFFVLSAASDRYAWRQLLWIGIGLCVFFSIVKLDYSWVARHSYLYYLIALALLLLVLVLGKPVHGSKRWFSFGLFSIQPSEFMKIAYVLALSRYLAYKKERDSFFSLLVPLILTIIPVALIAKQPDLGTSLILLPIFCTILFISGAKVKHFVSMLGIGMASIPLIWLFLLRSYQKARIIGFLWPEASGDWGAGYHKLQSLIAVGSGGLWGEGWKDGAQSQLGLIPEQHTDFIFSVISEEFGFLRGGIILGLYLIFILCSLGIATRCRDPLGRLIVIGFVTMFATQIFINVGMTLGIAPITGLTLPFMSYGGSSMITSFVALGFIINVRLRTKIVFSAEEILHRPT